MHQAVLLHGTGGSSEDYFWFADTKQFLESCGYDVWWPQLPHTENPELAESMEFIESKMPLLGEEGVIIAHSSSCPLVLTYLQHRVKPIKQAVLVAGFYESIDEEGFSARMLQKEEWDWQAIKKAAKEIVFINSDNDPWGCDDKQARGVAEKLGAKFIFAEGQGHMGSGSFSQPYREHTLVKTALKI